jgi:transposase
MFTMKNGPSAIQIADLYGPARKTVTRWAKRLNDQMHPDIDVLKDKAKPGRNTRMSTHQIAEIDKILKSSPKKAGLNKDKWTAALLSSYLKDKYDIELKTAMCQRWMRRLEDKKTKVPSR